MDDRSNQIIERIKTELRADGYGEVEVFQKQSSGIGDYSSFFEILIDRRLAGKHNEPSAEEVWAEMKMQINYLRKIIIDAEKEYKILASHNFDLKQLCSELINEKI